MGFVEAVKTCFQKYATFSGRASRSEYWYFFLFTCIFNAISNSTTDGGLDRLLRGDFDALSILDSVIAITLLIAGISAAVRRLHDLDKKGLWFLPVLASIVSFIILQIIVPSPDELQPDFGYSPLLFTVGGIFLVGGVFSFVILVWSCRKGTEGDNRFGPDPLQPKA